MANRWLKQFIKTADSGISDLDGYVLCNGASNAVVTNHVPLTTIARTGTGQYTVIFVDSWVRVKDVNVMPVLNTAFKDIQVCVQSVDPTVASKSLIIQFLQGSSAVDLGSGDGFFLHIRLKNSGLGIGE